MSNSITVSPDMFDVALTEVLDEYAHEKIDATKKAAESAIKKMVTDTKATAPVDKGKYRNAIAKKKMYENSYGASYVWYVRSPSYRLSHLLENGHAKKNGGRVEGKKFIAPAADAAITQYERDIREALSK